MGMSYSDIYFAVASVSTIAVAGLLLLALIYILGILHDIKRLSRIAKKEAEFIARSFKKGLVCLEVNYLVKRLDLSGLSLLYSFPNLQNQKIQK